MRWEELFADLEAQAQADKDAQWQADLADRTRAERAAVQLVDRLRAQDGPVTLYLVDGSALAGHVLDCGAGWVLLGPRGGDCLADTGAAVVPLAAVDAASGLRAGVETARGAVVRLLGLSVVLRGIARSRTPVQLALRGGRPVVGTLDAVAADHVDVACHPPDEPRRADTVTQVRAVRLDALVSVRPR